MFVSHDFLTFLNPMAGVVVQTQTFSKVSLYVLRIQNGKECQRREEIKVSLCLEYRTAKTGKSGKK